MVCCGRNLVGGTSLFRLAYMDDDDNDAVVVCVVVVVVMNAKEG